tara:strand:- start:3145 stop:3729 length:585 start_codon:yes stop_codon:yes gene_type:complete
VDIKSIFSNYIQLINNISQESELENLNTLFEHLENCFNNDGRIFLAGNGGSAAIANHAVTDLSKLSKNDRLLNPISLVANISQISAHSNDDGYENAFVLSAKNYNLNKKDVLIVISSSGNSKNIINLIKHSKQNGSKTFGLLGFDGGQAKEIVDFPILINSKNGYYGPVEDIHMMIFHLFAHKIKADISELNEQ